jgi:hypothetical protein
MSPGPSRRQVLAAALVAVGGAAAGCRAADRPAPGGSSAPTSSPAPAAPSPDPLTALLDAEQQLLAGYDRTARAHPGLAGRLAPLRADHAEHAAALGRTLAGTLAKPPVGTATGSPSPEPAPVPVSMAAALAELRAAEGVAATTLARAAETAPADRAALLASIAACEASHRVLLA